MKILSSLPRIVPDRIHTFALKVNFSVLSLLFPWECPGCRTLVRYPSPVCPECTPNLKRIVAPFCKKCGSPLPEHWKVEVCPDCKMRKSPLTKVRSMYYYEGLIQRMVLEVKYARRARYLQYFSEELFQQVLIHFPRSLETIVSVPLHRQREWERTFNQAELLARHLSRYLNIPVWKALRKRKKTEAQSSLSGAARRSNLKGAFELRTKRAVRSVLLVDDVITTGATLEECARVLRASAGVRKVYAITIARAVQQF